MPCRAENRGYQLYERVVEPLETAPRSAELFDDWGFDVIAVDIGEFEKMEGCVTCLSVLAQRT